MTHLTIIARTRRIRQRGRFSAVVATIDDRAVIEKILRTSAGSLWIAGHLDLPVQAPRAAPAP